MENDIHWNRQKAYVIFRLDDWQPEWLENIQKAIIDVFIEKQQKLCLGIIGKTLDLLELDTHNSCKLNKFNNNFAQYTYDLLNSEPTLLEVFNHGWDASLNYQTAALKIQIEHIQKTNSACQKYFGKKHKPIAFAPHLNLFHPSLTLQACQANEMIILSANCWDQPPDSKPKPLDALPLYIPTVSSTSAYLIKKKTQGKTKGVPAKITLDQIDKQIGNYGFACCMIHPQEFEQEDRTINYRQIEQLRKVIDGVVTKGLTIAWFSDLADIHLDSLQWRTNLSQFPQENI